MPKGRERTRTNATWEGVARAWIRTYTRCDKRAVELWNLPGQATGPCHAPLISAALVFALPARPGFRGRHDPAGGAEDRHARLGDRRHPCPWPRQAAWLDDRDRGDR